MAPLFPTSRDFRLPLMRTNFIRGAVAVAILWIGVNRIWGPADAELHAIDAQERSFQKFALRGSDLLADRKTAREWLAEREARSTALEQVPESIDVSAAEDQLSMMAYDCGLRSIEIAAREPLTALGLTTATFDVAAKGEYLALCKFLDALQSAPRLTPVAQLAIRRTDPEQSSLSVNLTIRMFAAPLTAEHSEGVSRE